MSDGSVHCPRCGGPLRPLTRRDDFFCRKCESAVSIVDDRSALVQSGLDGETLVPLEALRRPPERED